MIVAILLCYVPFLYLTVAHGIQLPMHAVIQGTILVWSAFAVAYVVEPISYFPALGTAGTYMSFFAGSIGQMRVPASRVAKDVAGVEDGTHEADLVAICGIAGSIYLSTGMITLTAVAGTVILSILPNFVLAAITSYVLPAIFGAVVAMFSKGRFKVAIPILIFAIILNLFFRIGIVPRVVINFGMLICVVAGVSIARFMYKKGLAK